MLFGTRAGNNYILKVYSVSVQLKMKHHILFEDSSLWLAYITKGNYFYSFWLQ